MPGVIERYPNVCRGELLKSPWEQLVSLLGADGQRILSILFMDCGLFVKVEHGTANLRQLSGIPIHDLDPLTGQSKKIARTSNGAIRKLSDIKFVRSRIFYGTPSRNQKDEIHFGLKRMHILNRHSAFEDDPQDIKLMCYVFPRQFKLHNPFTSSVDRNETAQAFKDYTVRDSELFATPPQLRSHLPRRLRGQALFLISKLRKLHHHCSYDQMMDHFCPLSPRNRVPIFSPVKRYNEPLHEVQTYRTQMPNSNTSPDLTRFNTSDVDCTESSFLPYAIPTNEVSAFCRAIFIKVIPFGFFGSADEGKENWRKILAHVDRFVHMRKFETLSLHEVCQGLKLKNIDWLAPANGSSSSSLSMSDLRKREELLHELVYYLFDSFLIPLVNSNFYVTESGIHRNRLLYFRHDVWERLCQPTLASLRTSTLMPLTRTQLRLAKSHMDPWYSVVRFLPKDIGTRPIANLKRRTFNTINGKRFVAQSVNARLAPLFSIFNYERRNEDGPFRSDSFSLQDLAARLSNFKTQIPETPKQSLFFVKVDIQSAFDSIPHEKLLSVANQIFRHDYYCATRHAEGKRQRSKDPVFRFVGSARPAETSNDGVDLAISISSNKKHVVFSDIDAYQLLSSNSAKNVLQQHVLSNTIKIGKDLYKKSEGIAQGSILSSLLCTFFYNDFEKNKLGFLDPRRSIILRIMDDFLLITLDKTDALRFTMAMKAGDTSYGIRVHPEKSLVNFDINIDGIQVPKLTGESFPFCGLFIDTKTLQVSKNRVRKDNVVANSLTVDLHGQVGAKFKRRVLSSLRIQLQNVLLHHGLNDKARIGRTLIESIQETTMKMHQYYSNMPQAKRPGSKLLVDVVRQLMNISARTILETSKGLDAFTRSQIQCLAATGILRVLSTRGSHYSILLKWLREVKADTIHSVDMDRSSLDKLVDSCFESVQHYRF